MENKRIEWVDAAKGIGIILVCLGHSVQNVEIPLNKVILSFHMPLFFFLSGYTIKHLQLEFSTLKKFFMKKIRTIILPMIIGGIALSIFYFVFDYFIDGNTETKWKVLYYCNNWFLEALFISVITVTFIASLGNKYCVLAIIIISAVFAFNHYWPVSHMQQAVIATLFSLIGYSIKTFKEQFSRLYSVGGGGLVCVLIPIHSILCSRNVAVTMADNTYGNKILFIINAFMGIIITIHISLLCQKSKWLCDIVGKHTLVIYITQFMGIYLIRWIMRRFAIYTVDVWPRYYYVFLLLILFEIPIVKIAGWLENRRS